MIETDGKPSSLVLTGSDLAPPRISSGPPLPLRELEALPRPGPAVLLAFLDAGIPGQETLILQLLLQLRIENHQGPRDAVANRVRLARDPAALDGGKHVESYFVFRQYQRYLDGHPGHPDHVSKPGGRYERIHGRGPGGNNRRRSHPAGSAHDGPRRGRSHRCAGIGTLQLCPRLRRPGALLRTLGDGGEHDVGDADASHEQGYPGDEHHHDVEHPLRLLALSKQLKGHNDLVVLPVVELLQERGW